MIIKLFEMFAGYGTATFGLRELGIDHEVVGFSEIDKYAIQCFETNHGSRNYGDAREIVPGRLPDFDLLTAGFPCQTFSVAGKGKGEQDTRGTLFHEIIRIAEFKKLRFMILENVKGLTFKPHKKTFEKILSELARIGYSVKWKILNSKDYGVPQNRERVFIMCFKNKSDFENFKFPEKKELKIRVKDILEKEVDEKYFLNENKVKRLIYSGDLKKRFSSINPKVALPIMKRQYSNWKGNHILQINSPKHSNNRIYSEEGISPALRDMNSGGNKQPFILASRGRLKDGKYIQRLEKSKEGISFNLTQVQKDNLLGEFLKIKNATKKGFIEGFPDNFINLEHPDSTTRRGRIQREVVGCLQCNDLRGIILKDFKIRKLTPKECFRLQGFFKDQINLNGISDAQKYKLSGNGQTLQVLMSLFKEMFK